MLLNSSTLMNTLYQTKMASAEIFYHCAYSWQSLVGELRNYEHSNTTLILSKLF